jgi:phospholipid/cholesterol/gamma-HCH transport system ATP-binding protein
MSDNQLEQAPPDAEEPDAETSGEKDYGDPDVNRRYERYRGAHPIVIRGLKNSFGDQVVHEDL